MLKVMFLVMTVGFSTVLSGLVGACLGARHSGTADRPGGARDAVRSAFNDYGPDRADTVDTIAARIAAEREAQIPARERRAREERGRWTNRTARTPRPRREIPQYVSDDRRRGDRPDRPAAIRETRPTAPAAPAPAPAPTPEPEPKPRKTLLSIPAGTVIEVRLDDAISTDTARVGDRVDGTLTRAIPVNGLTAAPVGVRVTGRITEAHRGGRLKGAARMVLRFDRMTLPDGAVVEFASRAVDRVGPSPGRTTATRAGGAGAVGALIGGIFGGKRGAAIGGSIGAAGGAASSAGRALPAALDAGTALPVTLTHPARVTVTDEAPR